VNYEEFSYNDNDYNIVNGLQYVPASLLRWFDDTSQYGFRMKPNIRYEPDELIHIYEPELELSDSKFGVSKLEKIQKPLIMMYLGLEYNQKIMQNEGIDPTAILSFPETMDDDMFNRELLRLQAMIQAQKQGGMLAVKGATYQSANVSNKDMDYVNMMNMCRDMIVSLYRVPPAMIGIIETANLGSGNGEAQKEQFKNVMNAKAKFYEAAFNKTLGRNGFQEVFQFNEMDIEDELKRANIESTQIRDGVRTVNEIRKGYGWDPVDWGNEPLGYGQAGVNNVNLFDTEQKSLKLENKSLTKALLFERLKKEY
jgi:phage portal protein BeeE